MKIRNDIRPSTRGAAESLGFYDEPARPIDPEHLRELDEQRERRYWWFPSDALERPADAFALPHLDGHVRSLGLAAYLWGGQVWQQQEAAREAEALTAATRGLFRLALAQRGFGGTVVETALTAFMAGGDVEVRDHTDAPAELVVDGKVIGRNVIAKSLRLTRLTTP